VLILDTHVLIWLDQGISRLGQSARRRIDDALAAEQLGVATISFWETAMLVAKGRLIMEPELDIWRNELLQTGLIEIPLKGTIAIRAGQLEAFHGDPADRMIVATAIENSATLMTADERILNWKRFRSVIDARV
jgi:PIN domain nuclease of toxin-antitoxin system